MSSALDRAAAVYDKERCARSFEEDLILHMRSGYVISSPTVFLVGRAVVKDADPDLILDPARQFDAPDCWLIWLAAGDIKEFFRYMPYYLPFMAWQKRNILRFYKTEEVRKRICGTYTLATGYTSGGTDRFIVSGQCAA